MNAGEFGTFGLMAGVRMLKSGAAAYAGADGANTRLQCAVVGGLAEDGRAGHLELQEESRL